MSVCTCNVDSCWQQHPLLLCCVDGERCGETGFESFESLRDQIIAVIPALTTSGKMKVLGFGAEEHHFPWQNFDEKYKNCSENKETCEAAYPAEDKERYMRYETFVLFYAIRS